MSRIRTWLMRLGGLFHRDQRDAELAAELESHVQMHIDEKVRAGIPLQEARRDALIQLGGVEQTKEIYRDQRGLLWMETTLQDLRFGLRVLRKSSGFTIVAVLTLAIGIGANTAMFSVIDSALLNPIPFPEPDRIVDIYANWPQFANAPMSYPNFLDLQRDNQSFQAIADWRIEWFTLTGSGEPERLTGQMISADLLGVLGVQPVLGRSFRKDEDLLGATPVAMLGERLWRRRFGADSNIIGEAVTLNGKSYTVVGIVPSSVRLLQLQDSYFDEVFVPVGQWDNSFLRDRRFSVGLRTVGRLKPGVTLAQAQADMHRFQNELAAEYPDVNAGITCTVERLKDDQIGGVRPALLMLWGAVGLVLLIACANVANLLLARANGRRQELAIRAALGAKRSRILHQLLIENLMLVAIGGTAGILLATWGTKSVLHILPTVLPATSHVEINLRVLAFAVAISFLAVILFGLGPGLRLSGATLQEKLQENRVRVADSHRGMQAAFVATEIALALVLLSGAGLLIRSLEKVWAVDPGFDPEGVLTCKVGFAPEKMSSPAKAMEAIRELTTNVASLPGVDSVAITLGGLPFELDSEAPVWPHEKPKPEKLAGWPLAVSYIVGPGYFEAMRIPVIRGRTFTEQDNATARAVTIVDQNLANSMFPGEDPIGKQLDFGAGTEPVEIVGVVGHVAQWGFDQQTQPAVNFQTYSPALQVSGPALPLISNGMTLIVRTGKPPTALVEPIRETVRSQDRTAVLYDVRTMHQAIAGSLAERRFSMTLLGVFAGFALLLATIGIYGVVSYLVSQQTHEIGIRMALGAQRRDILRDVLGQGVKMALAGVALGLVASLTLARLMASMLFGVSATDPLTYASVVVVLLAVAMLACWIPARRAMRVDPMVALRYE